MSEKAEAPLGPDRVPTGYVLCLLASFLFGFAIIFSRGAYSEPALVTVLLGFEVVIWYFVATLRARKSEGVAKVAAALAAVVMPVLMVWRATNDPQIVIYPVKQFTLGRESIWAMGALLLTYLPFLFGFWREHKAVKWVRVACFSAALLAGGYDTLKTSPRPYIDTWFLQQAAAQALTSGQNPYQVVSVQETGPKTADGVPYIYPPTQIYLSLPGWIIDHEVRWVQLACLLIAGLLLRFITTRSGRELPSVVEDAPMLFIWCTPKLFFILEQSWVDPVQVVLILAAVSAHVAKKPTLAAVLFGIVLTAKQTMFWLAGLAGITLGYNRKQWLIAGSVGGAMVLPFALWNFKLLKFAMLDFVSGLPPRADALTFVNFLAHIGIEVSGNVGFLLALGVFGIAAWKLRGSLPKFGLAAMTTYTFFFTFNRWAFANYYFLLAALSAMAAALALHDGVTAPQPAKTEPAKTETASEPKKDPASPAAEPATAPAQ